MSGCGCFPDLTSVVSLQVMNADLLEGDKVAFQDSGHNENAVLANETILMRGLVVRSRSNKISVRLYSRRPQPGSILLRFQGKSSSAASSCVKVEFLNQPRCKTGSAAGFGPPSAAKTLNPTSQLYY